jgi:hypothetical protein
MLASSAKAVACKLAKPAAKWPALLSERVLAILGDSNI